MSRTPRSRADRRDWPVRKFSLGAEPGDDLRATTTAAERLQMMWPLAVEAWTIAGRALPEYSRHEAPVKLLRTVRKPPPDTGPR